MPSSKFTYKPPGEKFVWSIIAYLAVAGLLAEYVDRITVEWLVILSTAWVLSSLYQIGGMVHDSLLEKIVREMREPGTIYVPEDDDD